MFVTTVRPELVKVTFTGKGIKAKYMIANKDAIGLIEQFDTAVKANSDKTEAATPVAKAKRTRRTKAQMAAENEAESAWPTDPPSRI